MGPNVFPNAVRPVANLAQAAVGAASAQSAVVPAGVTFARVLCLTAPICIAVGSNPTATADDYLVPSGQEVILRVAPGERIAAIRAGASDGAVRISWIGR
ncbi:hypothetical protein UFOVP345_40 [uncultured Caudovirales phage]|uniref:Uncharacterized protein n=1 Tax=uncultured Caudovirales phage TaxID=2100421 RepID=A0A6J5M2Z0_9CAUD|nr:hypothetical protein UFOVP345_40 [uncultured Caudovirales phage]